jgi:hypothetical protein
MIIQNSVNPIFKHKLINTLLLAIYNILILKKCKPCVNHVFAFLFPAGCVRTDGYLRVDTDKLVKSKVGFEAATFLSMSPIVRL